MKLSSLALLLSSASAICNYPVPKDATCLNQADFDQGTKIITQPGTYKLCEDIIFGPNGPAAGQPTSNTNNIKKLKKEKKLSKQQLKKNKKRKDKLARFQISSSNNNNGGDALTANNAAGRLGGSPSEDAYDPVFDGSFPENEYGLGYFSAIAIASSDVTLHLNGFKIEQSAGHALMQRFFAIIELASSPFIPGVGPAQFVGENDVFVPASNVEILGPGTLGRSSHHGVHGNENTNIKISYVTFRDFEVAAVALNNVDGLKISDNNIVQNRADVPVVGLFSAARFLRPYGKFLKEQGYSMDLYNSKTERVESRSAVDIYDNLIESINNVYEDVVLGAGQINKTAHPDEHHLFDNPFRVPDGPCYAFLVHGRGPAVGGQGFDFNADVTFTSSNVVIKDNNINNIRCWNNEVPALFGACGGHGCLVNDVRGAVFQTVKTFDSQNPYLALGQDGKYNGNVVSDMQIMVANAILDGTLTSEPTRQIEPNSITSDIVAWAQQGTEMTLPQYICNGDSMHHVVKGIIAIRVEDSIGFSIEQNDINGIENPSVEPFTTCSDHHIGSSSENLNETQSGNIRAISVAAVRGYDNGASQIKNNEIHNAASDVANIIIGIDIQGDSSDTDIKSNIVDLREGLFQDTSDNFIALRVREAVDGSIIIKGNHLAQGRQILNSGGVRGRARALKDLHAHASGEYNEWQNGGCPYAFKYAEK